MSSQFGTYSHHDDQVRCPDCGKTGTIIWEDGSGGGGKDMVRIEGGFYERLAKKPPYAIELVCDSCGGARRNSD